MAPQSKCPTRALSMLPDLTQSKALPFFVPQLLVIRLFASPQRGSPSRQQSHFSRGLFIICLFKTRVLTTHWLLNYGAMTC